MDSKSKSDFDSQTKHERTAAITSGFISSNILHNSNSVIKSSCDPIVAATFPFWVAEIELVKNSMIFLTIKKKMINLFHFLDLCNSIL